jgi:hypothetical protein
MNFLDAVKSGKAYRHVGPEGTTEWLQPTSYPNEKLFYGLTKELVLSNKWEVEERRVGITEGELIAAYIYAMDRRYSFHALDLTVIKEVAKKLGMG